MFPSDAIKMFTTIDVRLIFAETMQQIIAPLGMEQKNVADVPEVVSIFVMKGAH